jgi:chromosome segregation ATPase
VELPRATYDGLITEMKDKTEELDKLRGQLRVRGRNESMELHSSVTNSVRRVGFSS